MKKPVVHILSTTNFRTESIFPLIQYCRGQQHSSLKVTFISGVFLGDSISDLLFFSTRGLEGKLRNGEFNESLEIIRNAFPCIREVAFEFVHSTGTRNLKKIVGRIRPDVLVLPEKDLQYEHPSVFSIYREVQKSGLPMVHFIIPEKIRSETTPFGILKFIP